MTEDQARARLERMVAAGTFPELDTDEITDLLDQARQPDSAGRAPTDDAWEPTFELYRAAAEGWRWKAGKVAPDYSFGIDDQTSHQSDIHKHCLAQVTMYAALADGASTLGGSFSLNTLAVDCAGDDEGS